VRLRPPRPARPEFARPGLGTRIGTTTASPGRPPSSPAAITGRPCANDGGNSLLFRVVPPSSRAFKKTPRPAHSIAFVEKPEARNGPPPPTFAAIAVSFEGAAIFRISDRRGLHKREFNLCDRSRRTNSAANIKFAAGRKQAG